jgi:tRNA 2-selenouridine synthase
MTANYASLFTTNAPLLDLRSPKEFARGAFPNACNLPLLSDDERHQIGIRYQQNGQQAAIDLGHQLVHGTVREARMEAWLQWCREHPDGYLYCFRGGLRSQIVHTWLADAGCRMPVVQGGYKAMRHFLLESIDRSLGALELRLICGRTGSGKTRVIAALENALDLERRAHHRGSAFGRRPGGQPTQINFENAIAIDLLQLTAGAGTAGRSVVVEDEGNLIGRCYLPRALQERMETAPQIHIDEPLESRVELTLEDYVLGPLGEYLRDRAEPHALNALGEDLLGALDRIRKRLGGTRHREVRLVMEAALAYQHTTGDAARHRDWIRVLLRDYYDPMYDYLLKRRTAPVVFMGSRDNVLCYLSDVIPSQDNRSSTARGMVLRP